MQRIHTKGFIHTTDRKWNAKLQKTMLVTVTSVAELWIDLDKLTEMLGHRAAMNKDGKAVLAGGLIEVRSRDRITRSASLEE